MSVFNFLFKAQNQSFFDKKNKTKDQIFFLKYLKRYEYYYLYLGNLSEVFNTLRHDECQIYGQSESSVQKIVHKNQRKIFHKIEIRLINEFIKKTNEKCSVASKNCTLKSSLKQQAFIFFYEYIFRYYHIGKGFVTVFLNLNETFSGGESVN